MRALGAKRTSAPGRSLATMMAWPSTKQRLAIAFSSEAIARWWRRCGLGMARTSRRGPRSRRMFRRMRWEWRGDGRRTSWGGRRRDDGNWRGLGATKGARNRDAAAKLCVGRRQNRDGARKENLPNVPAVKRKALHAKFVAGRIMNARPRSESAASGAEAPFRARADGGAKAPPFQMPPLQTAKFPDACFELHQCESCPPTRGACQFGICETVCNLLRLENRFSFVFMGLRNF